VYSLLMNAKKRTNYYICFCQTIALRILLINENGWGARIRT
jgi:hypothetical protein